ncbi:hypothetical protein Ahy_A10g049392 isoform C [Arachis hypogaea]|uniref:BHLH domain-containing protein n=1 Tax=Arachis hypogaea TaxID=3818 RepID=A0A445B724_ARAHY|nr:hypothetical protein Ahy_A10g049392 isoform C [Arachis hypogaea]
MVAPEMIKHANQWCHIMVAFLIYRPVMRLLKSQRSPDGSQAYILDDIIDHVKYLQLQLKELSGSRLQAELTAIPLVFHEVHILCSESGKQRIILMDQESQEASIFPSSLRSSRKNEAIHKLGY